MLLQAACANCKHFQGAECSLGVMLPPGEVRCDQYAMTPQFKEQVVSAVFQDGGVEMRMKVQTRARLAAEKGRPLKGFRALRQKGKPGKHG